MNIESKYIWYFTFGIIFFLFFSCKKTSSINNSNAETVEVNKNTILYSWVNDTRIRESPNMKDKAFASLKEGEAVNWTGEQSNQSVEVTLRGKKFNLPFYKVILSDGRFGWVYAGALVKEHLITSCGSVEDYVISNFSLVAPESEVPCSTKDELCVRQFEIFYSTGIKILRIGGNEYVATEIIFPNSTVQKIFELAKQCKDPVFNKIDWIPVEFKNEEDGKHIGLIVKTDGKEVSLIDYYEIIFSSSKGTKIEKQLDGSVIYSYYDRL